MMQQPVSFRSKGVWVVLAILTALLSDQSFAVSSQQMSNHRSMVNLKDGSASFGHYAVSYAKRARKYRRSQNRSWANDPFPEFSFVRPEGSPYSKGRTYKPVAPPVFSDPQIEEAIADAKQAIATNTGFDISRIIIKDVEPIWSGNKFIGLDPPNYQPGDPIAMPMRITPSAPKYKITALAGNYTFIVEHGYSAPGLVAYSSMIAVKLGDKEHPWGQGVVTLLSLVDNRTGKDLVERVKDKMFKLFNPEGSVDVTFWDMNTAGVLTLGLGHLDKFTGGEIVATVDLRTGRVQFDPKTVQMVTTVRKEISRNLDIALSKVHVTTTHDYQFNDALSYLSYLRVSTPEFNVVYSYNVDGSHERVRLAALVNNQTGEDLLQNAMAYCKNTLDLSPSQVSSWKLNNGIVTFTFKFEDGFRLNVDVDVSTGTASSPYGASLAEALLQTKQAIAGNTGFDISQIHIKNVELIWSGNKGIGMYYSNDQTGQLLTTSLLWPGDKRDYSMGGPTYKITAVAGNYEFVLGVNPEDGLMHILHPIDILHSMDSYDPSINDHSPSKLSLAPPLIEIYPAGQGTVTLLGLKNIKTGVDYLKAAIDKALKLFNPEDRNVKITSWNINGDQLMLSVGRLNSPGDFSSFSVVVGASVNLQTGKVKFDPIAGLVMAVREKTQKSLGLDKLSDVHVTLFPLPTDAELYAPGIVSHGPPLMHLTTKEFSLTYAYDQYDQNAGNVWLSSLVSNKKGDVLGAVKQQLNQLNLSDPDKVKVLSWYYNEKYGVAKFAFDNGVTAVMNLQTGEVMLYRDKSGKKLVEKKLIDHPQPMDDPRIVYALDAIANKHAVLCQPQDPRIKQTMADEKKAGEAGVPSAK